MIYIHKLGPQELGYRNGQPGGGGRYFYISKECVSFFPYLSPSIKNDHIFINILSPADPNNSYKAKYVYHNDKHTDVAGTRDEYRLYLNTAIDPGRNFFEPHEIVTIQKLGDSENIYYRIHSYKPGESDYQELNSRLEGSGKTHLLVEDSIIGSSDTKAPPVVDKIIIPNEISEESLADPIKDDETATETAEVTRLIRSNTFRDLVLFFYDYKCAITGEQMLILHKDLCNLEAAHIIPRADKGGNNPANGVPLHRDLHWAFDNGFFTIDEDYKVLVHPEALHIPYLKDIHGKSITLPEDSRARPSLEALRYRKENIYGLFVQK